MRAEPWSGGGFFADSWWGTLLVRFGAVLPFVLAVVLLVLALAVLGVRLLPISPWTVIARSRRAWLERGFAGRSTRRGRCASSPPGSSEASSWPLVTGDRRPCTS